MPNPNRTNDPQLRIKGRVINGSRGELITFNIPLGAHFELVCLVNIPEESDETVVYVKHKVRKSFYEPRPQGTQTPADKVDAKESEEEEALD